MEKIINNFIEFKLHLIHWKQVPLLHTILCYEGDGLVRAVLAEMQCPTYEHTL